MPRLKSIRGYVLTLVFAACVPLAVMWVYATWSQVRVRDELAAETRRQIAVRTAETVRSFVADTRLKAESLAVHPSLQAVGESGCPTFLGNILSYTPEYSNLILASPDGELLCTARPFEGEPSRPGDQSWFARVSAIGAFSPGHPEPEFEDGDLVTYFGAPIRDEGGRLVAYVALPVALDRFQQVLLGETLPDGAIVTLAHLDGTVIGRTKDAEQYVGGELPKTHDHFDSTVQSESRAESLEGPVYDWHAARVDGSEWEVYAGLPQGWALRGAVRSLTFAFLVGGALLISVGFMAASMYETVVSSIRRLIEGTRAAAEGRLVLDEDGLTEVAEVARAFNGTLRAREAAEEQRHDLERQVLRTQKLEAVGRMAGSIAHDFNNRLAVVQGQADLLLESIGDNEEYAEQIHDIQDNTRRAAELTKQLLVLSRREEGSQKTEVDVGDMVRRFEPVLRNSFKADIAVVTGLCSDECKVVADRSELDQVFLNLANNARDAMPEGGILRFATRIEAVGDGPEHRVLSLRPGRYVVLSVTDTGIGMNEATRSRVFEPFFTTKPEGKGTGLGLSSVFGIVKRHAGEVKLYSRLGEGTTIEVWLPLAGGIAEAAAASPTEFVERRRTAAADDATAAEVPECPRGTILLAEDQSTVRRMITAILERANFRVLEARDGLEAVRIGQEHGAEIDAVVSDWIMPGLRGPAAVEKIHEEYPELPVLFISGYTDEVSGVTDMGIPGDRFLAKPFTREQLLDRLEVLLADVESLPRV